MDAGEVSLERRFFRLNGKSCRGIGVCCSASGRNAEQSQTGWQRANGHGGSLAGRMVGRDDYRQVGCMTLLGVPVATGHGVDLSSNIGDFTLRIGRFPAP
nr:K817 [uncultured bacterium]